MLNTVMTIPRPPADVELARLAAAGDFDAFETLYQANVGRVLALIFRMTGHRARAEELTQETFVRAWRRLGSFRGEAAFSSWLHRLAVNIVLSDARRLSSLFDRAEPLVADLLPGREPPGTRTLDLERAIADLPRKARWVFVLHDVEGHRHDEIADLLGISVGTSKSQLHRARRLLQEALS